MVYNYNNSYDVNNVSLGLSSIIDVSPYSKSKRQKRQDAKNPRSFAFVLKKAEQKQQSDYTPIGERLGKA